MYGNFAPGALRALCAGAALAVTALAAESASAGTGYLSRAEVLEFISELHAEHGLERTELERILGAARHQPKVVRLIGPPPAAAPSAPRPVRSFPKYRARFVTPARISAGLAFWESHAQILQRAETEFGVPAEVILAILGVETAFGRNTGSFPVLDALVTIAFDGPRRREYFRDELVQFLLLTRELGTDPLAIRGSYAGAIGLPQFMPSSYRRYAVDYDADGYIDLAGSTNDAIGSIGRYLQAHGWTAGEIPAVVVRAPGAARELVSGLQRSHTVEGLRSHGVRFKETQLPEGPCSLIELPAPGAPSAWWVGFGNFEAITRYNRSTYYAAAVLELAKALRRAHGA